MSHNIKNNSTIFKTKNNELAIFGKTLDDVKNKFVSFINVYEQYGLKGENGALSYLFGNKNSGNIITSELLDEFEIFKDLFNGSSMSADALAESLGGVDDRILNYAKTCKNGEMTTQGFKTSLEGMTLSAKASTIALKGLAIAGNMLAMWAVSAAIEGVIKLADELTESLEEQKEKLEETQSKISDYEGQIGDLENKINENEKKIDEINSNPLDIVSKNTLSTLKDENTELHQQLELVKSLNNTAKELAEDTTVQILENTAKITGLTQSIKALESGDILGAFKATDNGLGGFINAFNKFSDGDILGGLGKVW